MTGVEFVEEPVDAPRSDVVGSRIERVEVLTDRDAPFSARLRAVAPPVLFLAAAALAATAAFQNVYILGFGHGKGGYRLSVDAWGNYTGGNGARAHEHEARYAWALIACTVLFALVAVRAAVQGRSATARRIADISRITAIATCGLVAGIAVAIYLYAGAYLENQRTLTGAGVASGDPIRADIVTQIGLCPGIAFAAALCGALAVAASSDSPAPTRRRRGSPTHGEPIPTGRLTQ